MIWRFYILILCQVVCIYYVRCDEYWGYYKFVNELLYVVAWSLSSPEQEREDLNQRVSQ